MGDEVNELVALPGTHPASGTEELRPAARLAWVRDVLDRAGHVWRCVVWLWFEVQVAPLEVAEKPGDFAPSLAPRRRGIELESDQAALRQRPNFVNRASRASAASAASAASSCIRR